MANKRAVAKTATHALIILWEDRFFRSWKKKDAVVTALSKRDNHFSDAELGMALKRAGHLTRRGKRGSYEYIQRYPYVPEESTPATKKGSKK